MKIKDKVSGEVYEAETWTNWNGVVQYVKKGTNGPIRSGDDVEIIEEEKPKDTTDWSAFRREAAKDAMTGMMANADFWQQVWSHNRVNGRCDYPSEIAHFAIACADELIKQLKEKEK